jgi:uncharacterized protein (TIGR02145 family)
LRIRIFFKKPEKETVMKTIKTIITLSGVIVLIFSYGYRSDNNDDRGVSKSEQTSSKSTQTVTKSTQATSKTVQSASKSAQTTSKSVQTTTKNKPTGSKAVQPVNKSKQASPKPEPVKKSIDAGTIRIGTQSWAIANLNVSTFRNGDTIPEAKTNEEWKKAGDAQKPAWCYYNNDPANGPKYGKLYNWYAVNDPRGLAPKGWTLSGDTDWAMLVNYLGGQGVAGTKIKSTKGWIDSNNGTNESGFNGLPGGYRVENGTFQNLGSIGSWWSSTENNSLSAFDHYLVLSGSVGRSNSPKQRGSSVRCLKE